MSAPRLLALFLLAAACGLAISGVPRSGSPAGAQTAPRLDPVDPIKLEHAIRAAGPAREDPKSKLTSQLSRLADAEREARVAGRAVSASDLSALPPDIRSLITTRLLRIDEAGNVQVYAQVAGSLDEARIGIAELGGEVERIDAQTGIIQAQIPIDRLEAAGSAPAIGRIRRPDYPLRNTGSVTTAGDTVLRASLARFNYPVTGAGTRVGVISDGVEGLSLSKASGNLPASVNYTTCNVVPQSPISAGAGAEGTAMLEIVHDLAPGAELWFGHFGYGFGGTSLDFQAAVNCLAANTDVVVDDIGFFNNGPYNGNGPVSVNASNARNGSGPIRAYVNAVGNQALSHYQETYVDYNGSGSLANVHLFSSTSRPSTPAVSGLTRRTPCSSPQAVPSRSRCNGMTRSALQQTTTIYTWYATIREQPSPPQRMSRTATTIRRKFLPS